MLLLLDSLAVRVMGLTDRSMLKGPVFGGENAAFDEKQCVANKIIPLSGVTAVN